MRQSLSLKNKNRSYNLRKDQTQSDPFFLSFFSSVFILFLLIKTLGFSKPLLLVSRYLLVYILLSIGCSSDSVEVAQSPAAISSVPGAVPDTIPVPSAGLGSLVSPPGYLFVENSFEATDPFLNIHLEKATDSSITRSDERARAGSFSARFILNKTDPDVAGSKRAEVLLDWVEDPAFERWYGLSIFLPASYVADPAEEQLFQWHAIDSVDLDGLLMANSPVAMYTKNGRWEFGLKFGGTYDLGPYATDAWTDWVIHIRFSHGSDGLVEAWKNGKLVVQQHGRNNYRAERGNFFKIGIYKYPWTQNVVSGTDSRRLYYDEIRIGDERSSFSAVSP